MPTPASSIPQSSMLNERIVYQSIFDKLVDLDGEGKIIPMLAERWTVSGGSEDLHAVSAQGRQVPGRHALRCQGGGIQPVARPGKDLLRRNELKYVSKITVVDDHTIKLDLSTPFAPFLSILTDRAGHDVVAAAVKKYGEDYVNHPVGTGPSSTKAASRGPPSR
jgi:peptide/nickel transport system substrate-binding protein